MEKRTRIAVVGAGWAGLGAASHLAAQGYEVILLEAGSGPGGLVTGWRTAAGRAVEAGIHGFWYPYRNIFALVERLGIRPFTPWTRSAQYSPAGLEVESPIFQDLPRLPTPLGTFLYTRFTRLPLLDRASALPLLYAVVDFDNSDAAWRRYDPVTARELFKTFGVSARLYRDALEPMLLVGLFAPGELCSAAATLGMLYYFILAHQSDFDVVWCRGTVAEQIFKPWLVRFEADGGRFLPGRRVSDLAVDESGKVIGVVASDETIAADAVVFAVGITGMQKIIAGSTALRQRAEFRDVMNLGAVDVLATRLWFDRPIPVPRASNACFGFDATTGWTFFDLNALHDEYRDEPGTVIEADFYHASQLLAMDDALVVETVQRYLSVCVPDFQGASVVDASVARFPRAVTHFFPGSYKHMPTAETSFPNVFLCGDWIVNRHGSWSQEKAYVTGLEAANRVIARFNCGECAAILPAEPDEPHIQALRDLSRAARTQLEPLIPNFWLP
jgi:uncharacterized protein with NAD-binding domain and iron-sulfur cluster